MRVITGSRLHFGLMSLAGEGQRWPGRDGAPGVKARQFGGVGLMIDEPGIALHIQPAETWSAEGPLAERALGYARIVADGMSLGSSHIVVERISPEHAGFGTGTQLAMAVARALLPDAPGEELARQVGRGRRSAIGVHGFARGGLLVDGGKGEGTTLAPLLARVAFPEQWRVLIALTPQSSVVAGVAEQSAFDQLARETQEATGHLCRLALLGMVPALLEADLLAFGDALYEYNTRAGELFAPIQGGIYASPEVSAVVTWLRTHGVRGAGQSSWGPAVFGIVEDAERGAWLRNRLTETFPRAQTWLTAAKNR